MQIDIRGLRKVYPGGVVALEGLDLTIPPGVFGLLGPNGSGKTTLMRILATLLEPSAGDAYIDGRDVRRNKAPIREMLGYMPQEFGFYPTLTAYETLDYFALLCRMNDPKQRRSRIRESLAQVNLEQLAERRVGTFSGGMKRRLGIAQALLNDPRVLIVDEPTSGLDPEERIRLRNLLAELAGGRIVILSTHIVSDVEITSERFAILHEGRLLFSGKLADLLARLEGRTWIIDIEEEELTRVREQFFVTGVFRSATGMQVRVIADAMTHPRGYSTSPTLDDGYVATMRQEAELSAVD
ncbi:MAG: ABC transporter ATP-binding protein [Armatimonadota bacterium]|nr:MAG: ABC transporter ATP-binding protein [Armatimonadota bacterium]